jgi:glucokinase
MSDYAIGIDIGGTKIASVLINRDGQPIAQTTCPTRPAEGLDATLERVVNCIHELESTASGPVVGIGIGIAAAVDHRRGIMVLSSNLGWGANIPIRDLLIERLGASWKGRVWVDIDVVTAALGEQHYGAGRGAEHMLCLTVGTGVGGGMILDGHPYHGAIGGGGNIGHFILEPGGELCGCGKHGCLETLASGPAIARQTIVALKQGEESSLSGLDLETITAVEVVEAAKAGDKLARRILAEAGRYLGIALAYYAALLNPERIVIGGGLRAAGDLLLEPIRVSIHEWVVSVLADYTQIVPAQLDNAGAIGAGVLVWLNNNPD